MAALPAVLATGTTNSATPDLSPPTPALIQGVTLPPILSFVETERENREKKEAYLAAQEKVRIEKLETTIINKFLKSKDGLAYIAKQVNKGVREALEAQEHIRATKLIQLENNFVKEGLWFNRDLKPGPWRERFVEMNYGLSTIVDIDRAFAFLCERGVILGQCSASKAKYCQEYREHPIVVDEDTTLPRVSQGLRFKVGGANPPEYITALQAATPGVYPVVEYEYTEELAQLFKLGDPLNIYPTRTTLPSTLTLTQTEVEMHIVSRHPNVEHPIFTETHSMEHMGKPVLTPNGMEPMEPPCFPELLICNYEFFLAGNNARISLELCKKPKRHVSNPTQAWTLIKYSLRKIDLETAFPRCGTRDKIETSILDAIEAYTERIVHLYKVFFGSLIHYLFTKECVNNQFWLSRMFGMDDPLEKPPTKHRGTAHDNPLWAFSPGFLHNLEAQLLRHDMILASAAYHRHTILFYNLYLSLTQAFETYNSVTELVGLPLSRIIELFHLPNGEVIPVFDYGTDRYYHIVGAVAHLAYSATTQARSEVEELMKPVIDDMFKQLLTTEPYDKRPLKDLSIKLTPSDDAKAYIMRRLRQEVQQTQTETRNREIPTQPRARPSQSTSHLPPGDVAIYLLSSDDDEDVPPARKLAAVGRSQPSAQKGNTSGTPRPKNSTPTGNTSVPVTSCILTHKYSSCYSHYPINITGTPSLYKFNGNEQQWVVNSTPRRYECTLRTKAPMVEVPRSPGEHPNWTGSPGGSTVPTGRSPTFSDGLGLIVRRLSCEEESGEGAAEIQSEPNQHWISPEDPVSESDEGKREAQASPRGTTVRTILPPTPPRRKRRRTGRQRRKKSQHATREPNAYPTSTLAPSDDPSSPLSCCYTSCDHTPDVLLRHVMTDDIHTNLHTTVIGSDVVTPNPNATIPILQSNVNSLSDSNVQVNFNFNLNLRSNADNSMPTIALHSDASAALASLTTPLVNLGVNNISSYTPSVDELRILALGLNFIPEPRDISNFEIYQALDEYTDTVLWKEQLDYTGSFVHTDTSDSAVSQLRRKLRKKLYTKRCTTETDYPHKEKGYIKSFETNEYLHTIRSRFQMDISNKRCKTYHHLNTKESKDIDAILWDLKNNQLIVIKPADKNLGPTIMDRSWYIEAGELILKDTSTYTAIESFSINSIRNELIFILATSNHLTLKDTTPIDFMYRDWKNDSMQTLKAKHITYSSVLADILLEPFLDPENIHPCRSYFLPKLQKLLQPYPRPPPLLTGKPPPVRPICASIGWITYIVSLYLDIILKPLMLSLPSYIMNSAALAKHLDVRTFPPTCALLAADVESLYPSIDINRGLDALNSALKDINTDSDQRYFIVMLTRWVLLNNITEFNNKLYLQTRGTAMGTPCAVVIACIFMGTIERKAWRTLSQTHITPLLDYRFIDDLLIIAQSEEDAHMILKTFNSIDPLIQLTGTISYTTTNFLDLTLYKGSRFNHSNRFDLDVYQKPSNQFLFLPAGSYHPEHVFKGWIQGYLGRLRTNCTDDIIHHLRRQQF